MSFDERIHTPIEVAAPADSYDLAWVSADQLAVASFVEPADSRVSLVVLNSDEIAEVELPRRGPECVVRSIAAVARLPTGELGFANVCLRQVAVPAEVAELFAYDPDTRRLATMGTTTQRPAVVSWSPSMDRAIYIAEGSLCSTLYEHNERDGPVELEVTFQNQRIPLGEDLAAAPDGCTQLGNANFPAYARHEQSFALFVRATGAAHGQDRIDLPWALVLVSDDGSSVTILEGIRDPSDLEWLTGDALVFAGSVAAKAGLWVIRRDGSGLARVGNTDLMSIDVSPDTERVVGLVRAPIEDGPFSRSLALYDLHDVFTPDGD